MDFKGVIHNKKNKMKQVKFIIRFQEFWKMIFHCNLVENPKIYKIIESLIKATQLWWGIEGILAAI
jgi:hypothetical protein